MGKVKAMFQEYGNIKNIISADNGSSKQSTIKKEKEQSHEIKGYRYYRSTRINEERQGNGKGR